jgi:hypothetical protein
LEFIGIVVIVKKREVGKEISTNEREKFEP